MKILLPVDGSSYTQRMLGYLAAHEELLPGDHDFTAFTVIDMTLLHATRLPHAVSMEAFLADRAEQVLRPVRSFMRQQGWRTVTDHVPGPPAEAVVAKAEAWQPDLIVMGTRGRTPLGNLVLGSVAHSVLANCRFPVMLIR